MTLALVLFAVSVTVTAGAATALLWSRSTAPPRLWEASASFFVLAFGVATGECWLLSWFGLLDRIPLIATSAALAIPSTLVLYRSFAGRPAGTIRVRRWDVLCLLPLLLWIAFVLWRGAILPVLSHDALAYHMPKAVMLAQTHHYEFFDAPDPRIGTTPPDYEMLVAAILLLDGSDAYTEWVGTAAYIALLLLAAALAQRWWGSGPHVVVTVLLTAAVPVILLHAGAHKNDLLANVFYVGVLLWGGRWLSSGERVPLALMLLSAALATGTKVQGVFPIAALLLVGGFLLLRGKLRIDRTDLAWIAGAMLTGILLLGGWAYLVNLRRTGEVVQPASSSSAAGYGDWTNLFELPLLTLLRPFDPSDADIYVPWRGERWFWPRYELYFSDYGSLVTLLVLVLPLTFARYRRRGALPVRRERLVTSALALLAFVFMLPIRLRPLGFFAGFPRYFAFFALFVILWTAAPLVRELTLRRKRLVVQAIAAACAAILTVVAVNYTMNDSFQPFEYVAYVARHPGLRLPAFATYRAATVVDQMARPDDTIAIHSGFDSWIYPLYGRALRRKVLFIEPGQPIPPAARYVLVDRCWNIIWGDPNFRNTGQYTKYLTHGSPTEEDLAVVRRLFDDPAFEVVYYFKLRNQAVFRRREAKPPR